MDDILEKTGHAGEAGRGLGQLLEDIKKKLFLQVAVIFVVGIGFEPVI